LVNDNISDLLLLLLKNRQLECYCLLENPAAPPTTHRKIPAKNPTFPRVAAEKPGGSFPAAVCLTEPGLCRARFGAPAADWCDFFRTYHEVFKQSFFNNFLYK